MTLKYVCIPVRMAITFKWDDEERVLTVCERQGSYMGIPDQRTFRIVIVSPDHGTGIKATKQIKKTVKYRGSEMKVVI